jgi:hypothetical protein
MRKKDANCEPENFYMPIPSGVAYSIIAEAVNKFGVELVEKDITLPGSAMDEFVPKAWVLKGDKSALEKSREFMAKKIKEQLKSFE